MALLVTYFTLFFLLLLTTTSNVYSSKCQVKVKDKEYSISDWTWKTVSGNVSVTINFCRETSSCAGGSVCVEDLQKHTFLSAGKHVPDLSSVASAPNDGAGFVLRYASGTLPCKSNSSVNVSSEISVFCGRSLGNFEFVEENDCNMIFEFHTTDACKGTFSANRQIPCYVYDKSNKRRDLSPLIKQTGAYSVWHSPVPEFYINVCREISHSTLDGIKSPENSSAAINATDVGGIVSYSALEVNSAGNVLLRYLSADGKCSTNITFVCPNSVHEEGGKGPVYTAGDSCHYEILWETEYACPVDNLYSNTCTLANQDVQFDLFPLQRSADNYYHVPYTTPKGEKYIFYMNLCSDMKNFPCTLNAAADNQSVSVCQTWGSNNGRIAGDGRYMQLKYVNRELTLIYRHGEACHSGYHRRTIIYFHCQQNETAGSPVFRNEDKCNYYFDWHSLHACSHRRPTGLQCRITTATGGLYDLTALIKSSDNWEVTGVDSSSGRILMNVCGELNYNADTKLCSNGTAMCLINGRRAISLGVYKDAPTKEADGSVRLTYENGSPCTLDGRKRRSVITFTCDPGRVSTGPVFLRKSSDECTYEFVWRTAMACALGTAIGDMCQVSDPASEFKFDLSPLSQHKTNNLDYYSVVVGKYEYQLSVCKGSSMTKCGSKLVGGCQYDKESKETHVMGNPDSHLTYFDGFLNITYRRGDACHNKKKRETRITFLCDRNVEFGHPQFEKEVGCGTYNFLWYTKYACLPKMVECAFQDPSSGNQYDLSGLSSQMSWHADDSSRRFTINICMPVYTRLPGCSPFSAVCLSEQTASSTYIFKNNLGVVGRAPYISANGSVAIDYVNGDPCPSGGNMSSRIVFLCSLTKTVGQPQFDKQQSTACHFVFIWETSSACPQNKPHTTPGACEVKDPSTGYVFNLMALKRWGKPYYEVSTSSRSFVINICGNVNGSHCSMGGENVASCELKKAGSTSIGIASKKLEFKDGTITLTYKKGARRSGGFEYETVITFICDQAVPHGKPTFERQESNIIYFTFKTSLACTAKPIQCKLSNDDKLIYNLEPLSREGGYWTALNKYRDPQHHRYYINVCSAVSGAPSPCPSGAIGGCQVDWQSTGSKGHVMGYLQSNPKFYKDILSIRYLSGDVCHQKYNRSVRIFFHCSANEGTPVFQLETRDCEYVFNWMTPAACPLEKYTGADCQVIDKRYSHVYNLSPLKNSQKNVVSGGKTYVLSVCSSLPATTGCGSSAGACIAAKEKLFGIGAWFDGSCIDVNSRNRFGGDCFTVVGRSRDSKPVTTTKHQPHC